MTLVNYQKMTLKELRRYVLSHREDIKALVMGKVYLEIKNNGEFTPSMDQ